MKNIKLINLTLMLMLAGAANAQAQTPACQVAPSCAQLGYNKTAADCAGTNKLSCPFDNSKFFCSAASTPSLSCKVGDILYSDKSCSNNVVSGKTPIAVVVDAERKMAMAFDEKTTTWGVHYNDLTNLPNCVSNLATTCSSDGKKNTKLIMDYKKANPSRSYPAAEYTIAYSTAGTTAGDWFLPSYNELNEFRDTSATINATLSKLGKPLIKSTWYWSSTESSEHHAWVYKGATIDMSGSYGKEYTGIAKPSIYY